METIDLNDLPDEPGWELQQASNDRGTARYLKVVTESQFKNFHGLTEEQIQSILDRRENLMYELEITEMAEGLYNVDLNRSAADGEKIDTGTSTLIGYYTRVGAGSANGVDADGAWGQINRTLDKY